jgi:hypothetical protein
MTRGLTRKGAQVTSKEEDHKDELVQQSFEDAEPGQSKAELLQGWRRITRTRRFPLS